MRDERLRDSLEPNRPYLGLVAEAYDAWFPVEAAYDDAPYYARRIQDGGGPALEIGCGTGRLLLRYLAAGLDVEGVDDSPDMLAICRRHASRMGVEPVLHLQSMEQLALAGRYRTIYVPSSTFRLLDDSAAAQGALQRWRAHLVPGGCLLVSHAVSVQDLAADREWRLRRTGTGAKGRTFVVHEAITCDHAARVQVCYHRHEVYDRAGRLVDSFLRKQRVRWYEHDGLVEMLRDAGFVHVEMEEAGHETVFVARI